MSMHAADGHTRFVKPWGTGLLVGLDRPADDPSRQLLVHLILAGKPVPLVIPDLSSELGLPTQVLAKAMFALNRDECISVIDPSHEAFSEKPWLESGLGGLEQDMASIVKPRQGIVLASEDGLLLASVGVSGYEAEVLAVQVRPGATAGTQSWQARWLRAGDYRFVLIWSNQLDVRHTGLLRMGARLLMAAGETRKGVACECQ